MVLHDESVRQIRKHGALGDEAGATLMITFTDLVWVDPAAGGALSACGRWLWGSAIRHFMPGYPVTAFQAYDQFAARRPLAKTPAICCKHRHSLARQARPGGNSGRRRWLVPPQRARRSVPQPDAQFRVKGS
jgi:hypothetical protein